MANKKIKKSAKPRAKPQVKTQENVFTKNPLLILGLLIVIFIAIFMIKKDAVPATPSTSTPPMVQTLPFDFNNEKITLNDQVIQFTNGSYKNTVEQHEAMIMNRSVSPSGNRAAAILMDNPGGSGTFYYVIGALTKNGIETYSMPMPLGDRIQIVSVTVEDPQSEDNGEIIVEYLDRAPDAAMAIDPTIKTTAKFAFQEDGNLISVLQ